MVLQPARRRFSISDYYRLVESGILHERDRVELIDGEVVEMSPIGPRHAACVARFTRALVRGLGERAVVHVQSSIQLDEYGVPEPDLVVMRPRPDFYASALPTPPDVLLIVEVAESSVRYDRDVKAPLYARAGIPEYWLEDLNRDVLVVYRDPGPEGYRTARTVRRGERIAPLAFPDLDLAVEDVLGEAAKGG
jgi:Uma2 family endonuclease